MATDEIEGGRTRTLTIDRRGIRLASRKLSIDIVAGPDAPRSIELPGPEARLGSSRGCDLVLSDPSVSRHHATLRVEDRGVRVLDAGSRNGTTVDGVSVLDAYAHAESTIGIGDTCLELRLLSEMTEIPLTTKDHLGSLVGRSVAMRQVFTILETIAPSEATVLIEGATGTGKELAAEAVHELSARSGGPFVVFDCSAVSPNLIESELFGHVRGAFTGALADRVGAFEAANRGTLFLDEIGELPLELQPKLLRALENREVRRVGDARARAIDVRIVAATNRSLQAEVERGGFREDLYYRLAVVQVVLPVLKERPDDIPLLVERFVRDLTPRGRPVTPLPEAVVRGLCARPWPGNVRELRNAVERTMSLGAGVEEALPQLPAQVAVDLAVPLKTLRERLDAALTRAYVIEALKKTGGVVTRAADLAGVNRKFIQRAIKEYGLRGVDEES